MKLTAITFLIQSMIYSACIKRDGLLDEPPKRWKLELKKFLIKTF